MLKHAKSAIEAFEYFHSDLEYSKFFEKGFLVFFVLFLFELLP